MERDKKYLDQNGILTKKIYIYIFNMVAPNQQMKLMQDQSMVLNISLIHLRI